MANAFSELLNGAVEKMDDIMVKSFKGEAANGSDKAINRLGRNLTGGLEYVSRITHGGEGFGEAARHTFTDFEKAADGTEKIKGYKWGKIAGSYIGVAGAGRVLSGGGVYKDGSGNTNLVGIPFV